MQVIERNTRELHPYKRNAKTHTEKQIENIATSIRQFGFIQPLVVDGDGNIVIGHARYAAAKKLGMTAVPCVVVGDLTEDEIKTLRLVDNKLNESEWNLDVLEGELVGLDFGDFNLDWAVGGSLPEFMDFDGEGGGGKYLLYNSTKIRVVIGPIMFNLDNTDKDLYTQLKNADPEKTKAKIAMMLANGELP